MTTFQFTRFAEAGRSLAFAARCMGLLVPSFRTPPRIAGCNRTLTRYGDFVLVSVRGRGRSWEAVLADMIEGVVRANDLPALDADRVRDELWRRLGVGASGVGASGVAASQPEASKSDVETPSSRDSDGASRGETAGTVVELSPSKPAISEAAEQALAA